MAERAALVTGGSSGIGLAIAQALGEDGYGVTVAARRPEKLEAAAEELRSVGIDVNDVPANMTDEEAVTGAVQSHRERFGRMDVLVNNAGVGIGQPMAEIATNGYKVRTYHCQEGLEPCIVPVGLASDGVSLYIAATGEHRAGYPWHCAHLTGVAISPDGRWLATGGADNVIKLWPLRGLLGG